MEVENRTDDSALDGLQPLGQCAHLVEPCPVAARDDERGSDAGRRISESANSMPAAQS